MLNNAFTRKLSRALHLRPASGPMPRPAPDPAPGLAPRPVAAEDAVMTDYAELEFDLQQGVILQKLNKSDDPKGVCLALSGTWLKEKRTRTNGSFSGAFDLAGLDRKFHATNATDAGQARIVAAAAERQAAYEQSGGTANDGLDRLLRECGMRHDPRLSKAMEDCVRQYPQGLDSIPVTDIASTFTSATGETCLPRGRGVCIAVDLNGTGHAVAAYRSDGGSLHFFDPNLGVFKVGNPEAFFEKWAARYAKKGKAVTITRKGKPPSASEPRTFTCVW